MARRYTRDNRGRFASVGATARGGRLRTAAGNKRATVTSKLSASKPSGSVSKLRKQKPVATPPAATTKRSPKASKDKTLRQGRKVEVQIQRAKPGGQYGPDGHWYPGGAWMSQGKFIGGKSVQGTGAAAKTADQKGKKGNDGPAKIIRNRQPQPRPITPPGQGVQARSEMNKTAQKLNQEFFGKSGYLNENMEKAFRQVGSRGRAPIDNTRYLGALASRMTDKEMRRRTAAALKALNKPSRRAYLDSIGDAKFALKLSGQFGVPKVGITDRQFLNAQRFDIAARTLAGQRVSRQRRGGRSVGEEYAWVTNAMLSASRRRK